jgi:hypothetical protein
MNRAKELRDANNINADDELSFVVDQFKEITFRVGMSQP